MKVIIGGYVILIRAHHSIHAATRQVKTYDANVVMTEVRICIHSRDGHQTT